MIGFIGVVLLASGSPAVATTVQTPPEPATIVVQGRGVAERAPDAFFIGGDLRGQGSDQVAALRALTQTQARVADGLNRLDGLSGSKFVTNSVSVQPVYSPGCAAERRNRDESGCEVVSYSATMRFQFKGAPADQGGNAVSLAAEMGAQNVGTTGTEVDDERALKTEANRLAFADARRQADALADASGRRIVRIVRVQDSNARIVDRESGEIDEIVVTGSRVMPSVAVPLSLPPVKVEASLNVVFEIE